MNKATKYLLLPGIEFRGANAQPVWWCTATPGPSAALGLVTALAQRLDPSGQLVRKLRCVGLVIHHSQLRAERFGSVVCAAQPRAASWIDRKDCVSTGNTLASQPTVRCDGMVSLVAQFDHDAPLDAEQIKAFLDVGRFAGGNICAHAVDSKRLTCETMAEVIASLRFGFAFVDRADLLAPRQAERDPLDAFLRATMPEPDTDPAPEDDNPEAETEARNLPKSKTRPAKPWLMPYLAGMKAITPIEQRPGARDGAPHAFVDPMAGLGELVPLRKLSELSMWHWDRPRPDVFQVRPRSP